MTYQELAESVVEDFVEELLERHGVDPSQKPLLRKWMKNAVLEWYLSDMPRGQKLANS